MPDAPLPLPEPPPRYAPGRAFPPYAYITGLAPHPRRDPRGHSFGTPEHLPPRIDPSRPFASEDFLAGIDLFNHGYYWEAHEAWEGLWRVSRDADRAAAADAGVTTLFLQALIKLAAAGFKIRQGRPEGVRRHAATAARLLRSVIRSLEEERGAGARFLAIDLAEVVQLAESLANAPTAGPQAADSRPERAFSKSISLHVAR